MSRGRRWIGRVALSLVTLGLGLAAAEGSYRWVKASEDAPDGGDDDWRRRYNRMNETIYRRSEVPGLIYEPAPGACVAMEYGQACFDAHGMRDDRPHAIEPAPGRTRVAIAGDSIVWSEFLPVHASLPRRVQQALGDDYEVLPFGVSGYDTTQEALWYQARIASFRPDVLVVVWCMNDMLTMSGPFEEWATEAEHARKDDQERYLDRVAPIRRETIDAIVARHEEQAILRIAARAWGIVERWSFDRNYDDQYLVMARSEERRRPSLEAIGRLGAAGPAKRLFVISPVLESFRDYHWRPIHDLVREAAERAGFVVLDPLDAWRGVHDESDMRVSGDNLHYDESGNRIFGSEIAEAIRRLP